ncbi:HAD family hydrolase [Luteococcus sediminum]
MSTPSVVVFDIDGTLMDHAASARSGLEAWVTGLGHPMTDALAAAWTTAEQRHFTAWRDGEISFVEQRRRRLRDVLPLLREHVGDDDELDEVFTGYLRAYEAAWQPYPDVAECLATLQQQGRRLAVLSNGSDDQQRKKLALIGVAGYFPDVFTAESLGAGKPNREAYDRTAHALGILPSECLYVGDDYDLDVVASRAAGWVAIHLDRIGQRREADAMVTLAQLPALLA